MASTSTSSATKSDSVKKRGAFIVLEGLDRSGKSTQCKKLAENLNKRGVPARAINFPDRTTTTGRMINAYLQESAELDDHAIHLLFSVNRWEKAKAIRQDLAEGTTLVCDRYAFSGAAFSAAKGLDYEWCKSPDVGLPAPDMTFFLSLSPEEASKRGGFGQERYETSEIQNRVRGVFMRLGKDVGSERWQELDAGRSIEQVEEELLEKAVSVCENTIAEIGEMWR